MRVPRASRIYIPRVGPPAPPKKRELRDDLPIAFQAENPKLPGSKVHAAYERYKAATTVAEARSLGASRSMIKYDIDKGYATVDDPPAVLVLGLAAAPLVEAWCSAESELGRVGEKRGRRVIRYTEADDLSNPDTVKRALRDIRARRGTHLHGSIPCTPWTAWQRVNLVKAKAETRDRILAEREASLGYVRTFLRLGRAVKARGGSVSFEWPRHCEGWRESAVVEMLDALEMEPIDVDGCSVGVVSKAGDPILKPWRIAVSSPHMSAALQGLRCKGGHDHVPCAGAETARSAFYPEQLCSAIHDGLDAHEAGIAMTATADSGSAGDVPGFTCGLPPCLASGPGEPSRAPSGPGQCPASGPGEPLCALSGPGQGAASGPGEQLRALSGPGSGEGAGRRAPEPVGGSEGLPPAVCPPLESPGHAASGPGEQPCSGSCAELSGPGRATGAGRGALGPDTGTRGLPPAVCPPAVTVSGENKDSLGASSEISDSGATDPNWELFCLEHGMHMLAQDDEDSVLVHDHRPRNGVALGLYTALVTRIIPSSSPEAKGEGCMKALLKETTKLRSRTVWNEDGVEEWANVRKRDPKASVGRVFSILGEKNAERHAPIEEREYKARIVFAGNNIQTASGVAPHELFQEVSSAPAAMNSIRAVLAVSALRGWEVKARDAAQAYIQARIDGPGRPKTWVRLPKSWWPPSWFDSKGQPKFWDPVCPLQRALYGHPESGAIWEKHLAAILEDLGWLRIPAHPGTWVHDSTKALLAVYVDDLLMTAPPTHQDSLWKALEARVNFDEPPSDLAKFLGAHHQMTKNGPVTTGKVQMKEFLLDAVARYLNETGEKHISAARTPYLPENFSPKGEEMPGVFAQTCSSHLMKLLFAARLARPDIVVAITRLASKVTSWNRSHDRALHRLMQYVQHTADLELVGTLSSEDLETAVLVMSPDADLANDLETSKSTSGLWLELQSEDGSRSWPLAWRSKKQGSTASSTCEAEMISLATALKGEVLPMIELLEAALGRELKMVCLEDNTQCIQAASSGYSAALRHLPRTERISVGVVHEIFEGSPAYALKYQATAEHKGDMFTKRLEPNAFERALKMINLLRPDGSKYKAD